MAAGAAPSPPPGDATSTEATSTAAAAASGPREFLDLIQALDVVVWELDVQRRRYTFVSQAAERLLGYPPERWQDDPTFWEDVLVHPEDRERAVAFCNAETSACRDHQLEHRVVRADGTVRWARELVCVIRDEAGAARFLRGVLIDVTKEKLAAETLREREAQLAEAQAIAGIGSWDWDVAAGRLTWSDELFRLYGSEPLPEVDFRWYVSRVHPEDRRRIRDAVVAALETGESFDFPHRIVRPDGEVRWLYARGRVGRGANGRPVRMSGTSQDITERRQREEALRASEESYRAIFAHAGTAIWVRDLDTGALLDANRTAAEMFGYAPDEIMSFAPGGPLADERAPCDAEHAWRNIERARAGETPRFEWLCRRKDGTPLWVEITLKRVTLGGKERLLGTGRDIMDRKAAEEALRRTNEQLEMRVAERTAELAAANAALEAEIAEHKAVEQCLRERTAELERLFDALRQATDAAERANRAKSEFLSRMSHELRTPMNSILGFAQLLGRAELPPQHTKSVQHILKAGRHLLQLINEVLEIARIEAGRHPLSLEPVRVRTVVEEAMGLVRPLAAQLHVQLEAGREAAGDVYVRADRQRLAQVLLNLLSNAIKYNRAGGRVRLTCAVEGEAADPLAAGAGAGAVGAAEAVRAVVRVEDTGPGIPADRVAQLFTPFSRLGAEQSDVEGTGLGLALSQRLTEAMGGTLELERTGPEGSVFRLALDVADSPLGRLEEPAERAGTDGAVPHRPATLLYIEDNLANLSLVETILLSRPRWRTIPALQGRVGLELAREHAPDLVLLDLHLPDVPGEEVLRRLRAEARTATIPVVIISADATRATVERLQAAGVAGFLTKPLDIDEFVAVLERFLAPVEA